MADGIVTSKERHRREMARAVARIDAAPTLHARQHGRRSIRSGPTGEDRRRHHGDLGLIADVPGETSIAAADVAEGTRFMHG